MIRIMAILLISTSLFACGADVSGRRDPSDVFPVQDDTGETRAVRDFQRDLIESAVERYRRNRGLREIERPGIVELGEYDDGFRFLVHSGELSLLVVLDPDSDSVVSVSASQADQ